MRDVRAPARRLADTLTAAKLGFLLLAIAASAAAQNPLEPVDTSSPRATLESFLALTEDTADRYEAFREAPGPATQRALRQLTPTIERLFDLSEVAPAARTKTATETYYLLWDVIARLELPNPGEIPDTAAISASLGTAEPITRWRIPGTNIAIARVALGARSGEFLFSAETVAQASNYYEAMRGLPYLRPARIENIYRVNQTIAGWLLPPQLIEALPEWANTLVVGQTVWKWFVLFLIVALAVWAGAAVFRSEFSRTPDSQHHFLYSLLRSLSRPLVLWLLAELLWIAAVRQINVTGSAAALPDLVRAATRGVAAVWIIWVIAHWTAERIIASPKILTNSLHANVLRFLARFIALFAGSVLLFFAAQKVGVPVYGLVAGAGVGGLAIALAVRSTLENLVGTLNIYIDRPVRIGDSCRYGKDPENRGTVEEIGLRSTRIRGPDRSITTIPNGEFANLHIVNLSLRDRFLMSKTIGLRYETTPAQLEAVLGRIREMLLKHAHVDNELVRVYVADLGPSALEVCVQAYVVTSKKDDFLTIQEDILLRTVDIVHESGSAFAFPSSTVYQARDPGIDPERQPRVEALVSESASSGVLRPHGLNEDQ